MSRWFGLLFMGMGSLAWGSEPAGQLAAQPKAPAKKIKYLLAPGFATHKIYRGAVVKSDGDTIPGFAIEYGSWTFSGKALKLSISRDSLQWALGFDYVNDNGLFGDENRDFRTGRAETYEAWAQASWAISAQTQLKTRISQDIRAHWGQFLSVGMKRKVLRPLGLGLEIGAGTQAANKFVYGKGARAGFGFIEPSLGLDLPILPWAGILRGTLSRPFIFYKENRSASFVRGSDDPLVLTVLGTWFL